jgi:hypothetical protein
MNWKSIDPDTLSYKDTIEDGETVLIIDEDEVIPEVGIQIHQSAGMLTVWILDLDGDVLAEVEIEKHTP